MSKVIGFVVGAAMVVVGLTVPGAQGLILQGALMIVSSAVLLLTQPKTPARNASEMSIQLGEQPRVLQLGETATAGSLVDGFNYGGKYGTQWEVLIIRLADHKCHSLTGFYVNDEWNGYVGDGYYPRYGTDNLQVFFRSDTTAQPLPSIVTDNGPGWTSADIGESGCDVIVAYKCDKPDTKHPVWPGGRPRFLFVLKGAFCYDPRLDDTVDGGSGPHRIDDPDTWEWTENAAICRYKWVRGVYANDDNSDQTKLLVGRGLSAEEAPPENVFAAANLCDELSCPTNPYRTIVSDTGVGTGKFAFAKDFSVFLVATVGSYELYNTRTRTRIVAADLVYPSGNFVFGTDRLIYGSSTFESPIFSGDGRSLVGTVPHAHAINTVYWAGGKAWYDSLTLATYAQSSDGDVVDVGFKPVFYFTDGNGYAIAVGNTGATIHFYNVDTLDSFDVTSPTGSGGGVRAVTNSAGEFFCVQGSTAFLVDPVSETVGTTAALTTTASTYAFTNHDGTDRIWLQDSEWDILTCAKIREIDYSDWDTHASSFVYDPVNNDLIGTSSSSVFILNFISLDHHAGYRVAGPVYSNQDFIDVEGMFAAATGGTVVTREGSVELNPGHAESVVFTFTDADLLSGSKVGCNRGILSESSEEWINTVVGRYVEPDQKWQDHGAPVVRDTADIEADGKPREVSIPLRLVRYQEQALRVAEITRRLGRLWWRGTVTLGPAFCEVEDGDWGTWVSSRFPGGSKTFRVEAYSIDEKWQNTLTLREINAGVYGCGEFDPDLSEPGITPLPPDVGEPDSDNWTLTATTLDSEGASVPALHIEGDASDDELVEQIIFEYWQYDGVTDPTDDPDSIPWITEGTHVPTTTQTDITSVIGGATYYVAVSYIVDGETGERLVLGPVTLSDYAPTPFFQLEDSFTPIHFEDDTTLVHLG